MAELVGHSNIRKNDTVVDLGAGSGVITSVLATRVKKVFAVELEPHALAKLRQNVGSLDNVQVVEGDILQVRLPTDPYKVFSNIPFQISSQVIKRLTSELNPPKSIYLIVQKQFAHKVVPSDTRFTGQLGAMITPWWQARIRKPLRRTDFTPPPAVDTVLLELKPREQKLLPESDRQAYENFVEVCYSRQAMYAKMPLSEAGISSERKPSELTPEQWVRLYNLTKGQR